MLLYEEEFEDNPYDPVAGAWVSSPGIVLEVETHKP